MNVQVLIDAIVRQTTVLLAQLATSGGLRAPLAHVANQVFVDLTRELEAQGVSRKVSADMFGMALRGYLRKVQRLRDEAATASTASCVVPGSATPVAVPVTPQLVDCRASDAVYCSCRCGGSGPGPFCACPTGYECATVVPDVGIGSSAVIEGSYCIKTGTTFDPDHPKLEPCSRTVANCEEP